MEDLKIAVKYAIIFIFGGLGYGLIEVVYRGYTHYSMVLAGGICFCAIVALDNRFCDQMSIVTLSIICSAVITVVEFIFGVIFNLWLKMNVWDYSGAPLNVLGQICLPFSLIWAVISAGAILLNRYVISQALVM